MIALYCIQRDIPVLLVGFSEQFAQGCSYPCQKEYEIIMPYIFCIYTYITFDQFESKANSERIRVDFSRRRTRSMQNIIDGLR